MSIRLQNEGCHHDSAFFLNLGNKKHNFRMSICQHVSMSICQYVRMQLFSLVIKMKVVQNVKTISENIISVCQHVSMSICPYVNMSICQNATFQLRYQNESCSECHHDVI